MDRITNRITRRRFLAHDGPLLLGAGVLGVAGLISSCTPPVSVLSTSLSPQDEQLRREQARRDILRWASIVQGKEIQIANFTSPHKRFLDHVANTALSVDDNQDRSTSKLKLVTPLSTTDHYRTPFDALASLFKDSFPSQYQELNQRMSFETPYRPPLYLIEGGDRVDLLFSLKYPNIFRPDSNFFVPFDALIEASLMYDINSPNEINIWTGQTRKDDWDNWARKAIQTGRVIKNKNLLVPAELLVFKSELGRLLGEPAKSAIIDSEFVYGYRSTILETYLILDDNRSGGKRNEVRHARNILKRANTLSQIYRLNIQQVTKDGALLNPVSFLPLDVINRVTQWDELALKLPQGYHLPLPTAIQSIKQVREEDYLLQFVNVILVEDHQVVASYLCNTLPIYTPDTQIIIPLSRPTAAPVK